MGARTPVITPSLLEIRADPNVRKLIKQNPDAELWVSPEYTADSIDTGARRLANNMDLGIGAYKETRE